MKGQHERELFKRLYRLRARGGIWAGGAAGAGGGSGGGPNPIYGQWLQTQVTFDTTMAASSSGSGSLLDNLNRIRQAIIDVSTSGSVGHIIYDSSGSFTQRPRLKFTGNVYVSDDAGESATVVNFTSGSGAGHIIRDTSGSFVQRTGLRFTGGVTVTDDGGNNWTNVEITTGSGAEDFLDLTDTPSSYVGEGEQFVAVNVAENALEFVDAPSSGSGGHTIEDPDGVDMTQRANLQFYGPNVSVTDDAGNDRTRVTVGSYPSFSGARAYSSGSQSIANSSWDDVEMDSENYDTDDYHSVVSDTSRLLAPETGYYHVTAHAAFDDDAAGASFIQLGIWRNQISEHMADCRIVPPSSGSFAFGLSTDWYLTSGQDVRLRVFQSTGSAITCLGGAHRTFISIHETTGPGDLFSGGRTYLSSSQTIATGTWTSVGFGTESYDVGDYWTSGSSTRHTVPEDGKYHTTFNIRWQDNATGIRAGRIRLNGTATICEALLPNTGSNECTFGMSTDYDLSANDYLEFQVYHERGSNLDILATVGGTFASTHLVGAP
jgi:hypothetical protein